MNFTQEAVAQTADQGQYISASNYDNTGPVDSSAAQQGAIDGVSTAANQVLTATSQAQMESAISNAVTPIADSQQYNPSMTNMVQNSIATSKVKSLIDYYQSSSSGQSWSNSLIEQPSSVTSNLLSSSVSQWDAYTHTSNSPITSNNATTESYIPTTLSSIRSAVSGELSSLYSSTVPGNESNNSNFALSTSANLESSKINIPTVTSFSYTPTTNASTFPNNESSETSNLNTYIGTDVSFNAGADSSWSLSNIIPPTSWISDFSVIPTSSSLITSTSAVSSPTVYSSAQETYSPIISTPTINARTNWSSSTTFQSTPSFTVEQPSTTSTETSSLISTSFSLPVTTPIEASLKSSSSTRSYVPSRTSNSISTLKPVTSSFTPSTLSTLWSSSFDDWMSSSSSSSTISTSTIIESVVYTSTVQYMVSTKSDVEIYYYNQPYYFTDSATSFLTKLGVSTTVINSGDKSSKYNFIVPTATVTAPVELYEHWLDTGNLDSTTSSHNENGTNKSTIIGGVVGSLGGVLLCSILVWFIIKKFKRSRMSRFNSTPSFSHSRGKKYNYDTMKSNNEIDEVDPFRSEFKFDKRKESNKENVSDNSQSSSKLPPIVPNPRKNNVVTYNSNDQSRFSNINNYNNNVVPNYTNEEIRQSKNSQLPHLQTNFDNNLNINNYQTRFSYASSDNGTSYNSSISEGYSTIFSTPVTLPQDGENPPHGFLREII